jgi:hypothetical protein
MGKHRALWLWGILLVAGCPDDGGGGGGSAVGPVPEDDAPETAVNVVCAQFESCDCDPASAAPDGCEASIEDQVREAQGDATAAGLEYDAACMGKYLSGYRELGCRTVSDFTFEELVALAREYQCKVYYGTDEPGEACETVEDLGDSCVVGSLCVDALCVALTDPVAEGQECNDDVNFVTACVAGTICLDIDDDGRPSCVRIPELNDPCLGAVQICNVGLACMDGTCLAAPGEGEACHLTGGNPCGEGLECNFETSVCQLLPAGGEDCTFACADGFTCDGGRCVALEPIVCDADLYSSQGV